MGKDDSAMNPLNDSILTGAHSHDVLNGIPISIAVLSTKMENAINLHDRYLI